MSFSKFSALLGLILLALNTLGEQSLGTKAGIMLAESAQTELLKNVSIVEEESLAAINYNSYLPSPNPLPSYMPENTAPPEFTFPTQENTIMETYIPGGMSIKNNTDYEIDVTEYLSLGPQIKLPSEGPQILIMHTHGSEAYTPAGLDRYEESDDRRTEDVEFNVIRIGAELAKLLEEQGLSVIHDPQIHDYPSYTGSYTRSEQAIQKHLSENPGIAVVLDIHRDALDSNGVIYKTMADESGVCASQIMMLCGSNASGLQHDNWQKNFSLAVYLQQAVNAEYPTLMRPVSLVKERYNTHLTTGSLIVEVGSSGNTLQEALAAIRLFAQSVGPALKDLVDDHS